MELKFLEELMRQKKAQLRPWNEKIRDNKCLLSYIFECRKICSLQTAKLFVSSNLASEIQNWTVGF